MRIAADLLKEKLATYEGLLTSPIPTPAVNAEMKIRLNANGRSLGLTQADLGRQIRQAYYGEEIQRIQRERDEVKVMLRYPLNDRKTLTALSDLRVRANSGIEAPLSEVASIVLGQGYPTIKRTDRSRIINVQTSADKDTAKVPLIENDLELNLFLPYAKNFRIFDSLSSEKKRNRMKVIQV